MTMAATPGKGFHRFLSLLPVAACLFVAIWHMRLDWIYDESYRYGWLVPPLALYLFSVRWRDRLPPAPDPNRNLLPGWATLAVLLPVAWLIREANPEWRLLSIAFTLGAVAACLLYLDNTGGKALATHFAGAIFFLFAAVPWPTFVETAITSALMPLNASLTLEALHWMQIPATQHGNLIGVSSGTLGVEEACSGIRSLHTTVLVAWFVGELQRLPWRGRLLLIGGGVGIALGSNILRTVFLSVVAAREGLPAADSWHDTAGLAALGLNCAAIFLLAWWIGRRTSVVVEGSQSQPSKPTILVSLPVRGPVILTIGLAVMLPLTLWWYGRHETTLLPPWHLEKPSAAAEFRELPVDKRTANMLRYSKGWSAQWKTTEGRPFQGFYFEWDTGDVPPENMNVHRPGGCLAAIGIEFVRELPPLTATPDGIPLTCRVLLFNDRGRPLHILYLVQENSQSEAPPVNAFDFSYMTRLHAVRLGRRNPGQRFIEAGLWDEPSEVNAREIFTDLLNKWVRQGGMD